MSVLNRFFVLFYAAGIYATVSSTDVARINDQELMVVDDLIKRINDDNWHQEEAPCLENTLTFLRNVKNLTFWATWVWESNQYPIGNMYGSTYQMGNYDQCMNPPWLTSHPHPHLRTQYCTAEVKMTGHVPQKGRTAWDPYGSTEEYINTETRLRFYLNTFYWGVCVPAACSPRSVGKLLGHMYRGSQYAPLPAAPNITVDHCQVAGERYQYPVGFYMFIATIVLLLGVAIASTVYQSTVDSNDQHPDALATIISKVFCMKRNYSQLIKANPGEIHVMNGIRFITSCLIVLLHQITTIILSPTMNKLSIEREFESLQGLALLLHFDIVVDTFFAMSGLLHVRGLMGNSGRQKNLISVLWRRYIRLLGPLAVTIFYLMYVDKHTGSGPFWPKFNSAEADVCANTWGLSLMMLNTNVKEICHIVTWYIACDYQLAILGTVLFYFYQRDKKLGYTAFGTAAALSVIIPGVFVYWHRLPAMPFPDFGPALTRENVSLDYNYFKSYVRANAYLVGIAMGYFLSVFKPADNRRAISTKWSLIGTIGCVATMLSVMGLGKFFFDREYSVFESIITTSLNRAVWAFAVCCIIAFCEYGNVPIISDFLSLPAFVPLSRLAYGIYVIHPFVIQRNLFSARTPLKYEKFSVLTDTLGTVCMSACISFFMWLLIEAPCINLSNALFMNKTRSLVTSPAPQEQTKEFPTKEVKKNGAPRYNDVYAAWNKTKTS